MLVEMPSVENRARGESGWWCGAPRELFQGFQGHGAGRMGSDPVLTRGSCCCRLCKSKSPKELLGKEHHAPSKPCSQSAACSSPSLSNSRARSGWAQSTPSLVPAAHSRAARQVSSPRGSQFPSHRAAWCEIPPRPEIPSSSLLPCFKPSGFCPPCQGLSQPPGLPNTVCKRGPAAARHPWRSPAPFPGAGS